LKEKILVFETQRVLQRSLSLFVFYAYVPKRNFGYGLRPEIFNQLKRIIDPVRYYERVLKETPLNKEGFINLQPDYFHIMMRKCTEPEHIDATVTAFYNFLGHQARFHNYEVDAFLRKAIECRNPQATHEILANHNYLMYYPHPDVIGDIMKYYKENKLLNPAKQLFRITNIHKLIKTNASFYEDGILLARKWDSIDFAFAVYNASLEHDFLVSRENFVRLIDWRFDLEVNHKQEEKKKHGPYPKIFKNLDKYPTLDPDYWIRAAFALSDNFENSLKTFEMFSEKDFKLKEGKYLLKFSKTYQKYVNAIYERAAKNKAATQRITDIVDSLKQKYGEYLLAPEPVNENPRKKKSEKVESAENKTDETETVNLEKKEEPVNQEEPKP